MSEFFSKVFQRDKRRCVYCGRDLMLDFDTFMLSQEDHLIPKSKGGPHESENIVTSCMVCNLLKGNYVPSQEYEKEKRQEYIATIRHYVMERRAEKMADFISWTHPTK
ncbi:MAG: HNH endonuclease [Candidatus Zixiibacteriota bacterium]